MATSSTRDTARRYIADARARLAEADPDAPKPRIATSPYLTRGEVIDTPVALVDHMLMQRTGTDDAGWTPYKDAD